MTVEVFTTPDKCDGCPIVKALAEIGTEQHPIKMSYSESEHMDRLFEACPGFKTGVRAVLRQLRVQFHESLGYGGDFLDADSGTRIQATTLLQPQGCGTPIREFAEITGPIKNSL